MKSKQTALQRYGAASEFESAVVIACAELAPSEATRDAYLSDFFKHWLAFCREYDVDPQRPEAKKGTVVAFMEWMKKRGDAPKSRARRMSALSSIYRQLRRSELVDRNPFSADEGPRRGRALPLEPTPIASPAAIGKLLSTCDDSILGIRDAAIIRVLWATGLRRASVASMTFERLRRDRGSFVAIATGKGDKELRVLIRGKAAEAFSRWLDVLKDAKLSNGPIWRTKRGPMTERAIGHMLDRRAEAAGIDGPVSPHTFRVAFLTYNPAGIEAKQDAAGHADPATTRLYDRASWRGREAFEQMPEIEEVEED
jgi:site-specific recombinase XerD